MESARFEHEDDKPSARRVWSIYPAILDSVAVFLKGRVDLVVYR